MKQIKCYLDTTIFNFVFAQVEPSKKEITKKLFHDLSSLAESVYISEEVIREISRASEPRRSQLEELVRQANPLLLSLDSEVEDLAEEYIKAAIIPERYRADARHIAAAVVNEVEVLISWNFEHIVKLKTRTMVNGLNKLLGYREIEICSPEEVVNL